MFCKSCGFEIKGNSRFCIKCGNPLFNQDISSSANDDEPSLTTSQPNTQRQDTQPFVQRQDPQPAVQMRDPQPTAQMRDPQQYPMSQAAELTSNTAVAKKKTPVLAIILAAVIGMVVTAVVGVVLYYFVLNNETDDVRFIEGPGYSSAEDAVSAYLEAFSNTDVESMISTFAVETYVKNYDFEAMINRLRVYTFNSDQVFPSDNQFTTGLNIQRRQSRIADSIRLQYINLFIPDAINDGRPMPLTDDQEASSFIRTLSDQKYYESIQKLEVVGFVSPDSLSDLYSSEMNQRNMNQATDIIGAQELENVVSRVKIDSRIYLFCFDVARYGERWYINTLGGNIAPMLGLSAYAMGAVPEFEVQ
ncbi:MAG: zinc ribbon domain-containing protein [Oscillospiraceae bacterium]|nr:zinc ribbon domain-containing protein [Oscillospiraceae bacterium]